MSQLKYKIYPSLLNKYSDLLHADVGCEAPWNKSGEDYILSPEEFSDKLEQELIDTINRVKHEPSEAASAGVALNEALDRIVLNTKDGREDIKIYSSPTFTADNGMVYDIPCVYAEIDGFKFCFDRGLLLELKDIFKGAIPQYRCRANMDTKYGTVELYGDIDYILRNKIVDLKSTSNYDFGKFSQNYQRHLYTYCLTESGDVRDIDEFTYFVCKWRKSTSKPWTADLYGETYSIKMDNIEEDLRLMVERFIEWLENHRALITDKKIFAED